MSTNESGQTVEMMPSGHMPNLEAQLLTKAIQDPVFRERLISDPKMVLAEQGLNIPDDVQITVLQETPTQYYLILPALEIPTESGEVAELSDEELETVAGGGIFNNSQNSGWTGCASGRSGCVASNGCYEVVDAAMKVATAMGSAAAAINNLVTPTPQPNSSTCTAAAHI